MTEVPLSQRVGRRWADPLFRKRVGSTAFVVTLIVVLATLSWMGRPDPEPEPFYGFSQIRSELTGGTGDWLNAPEEIEIHPGFWCHKAHTYWYEGVFFEGKDVYDVTFTMRGLPPVTDDPMYPYFRETHSNMLTYLDQPNPHRGEIMAQVSREMQHACNEVYPGYTEWAEAMYDELGLRPSAQLQ